MTGRSSRPGMRKAIAAGALALALGLSACGDGVDPRRDGVLEQYSAQEIYQRAEYELARGRADDAAIYFGEIERLYPYSEWAKRGLIMAAFSYHQDRDYDNSRIAAQRYLDFYPAEADAAYAQYLLALSYYDQMDQIGNDQAVAYDALQALRLVIERYPDSEYTQDAVLRFDVAMDQLAASEMEVGRYYLRRQHYTAAINRFRLVVEEFQTTSHTPEALLRLVEAYLSLGLTDEASTAGAILGYNFQGSPFYDDAFRQLTGQGLTPDAAGQGWLREVWDQTVRGDWL
ncbi:MAG: outer membrane protein assembly factor BamD [Rhodobacteraceae bacterium HLUCCO18]|nr:MAG: outer membrane protein assembly factor BamD [Rhodobacteraceae bacterium HLUCCO18]